MTEDLIRYLSGFISDERLEIFNLVLDYRTRYLCIVLEDIYQAQNASAVIRTCDCFGIQDLHIIQNKYEAGIDRNVTMGSHKWLTFHYYTDPERNTLHAIEALRTAGYRIVATSPHQRAASLDDFSLENGKAALFFGTELTGLSSAVMRHADEFIRIPMYGFTRSFNLSVSAAITLQTLVNRLHHSSIQWNLTTPERNEILLSWLRKSIRSSARIEARYFQKKIYPPKN